MPLEQGTRIGPYEIATKLGAGGMGEVYRARDTRLGRDVAVKVLPERFSADRDRLQRFDQEARAAAALSHPNILAIYDVGAVGAISYVVTELLEGDTLRAHVTRGHLPQDQAINVAMDIAWYDRELADIFAIQDEITQSIVRTLEPKLLGHPQPVRRRHSENLEAFELCLKGRHFWYQRTESSMRAGINCFTKAVELDPHYALAHAGLADSFSVMRPWGYVSAQEARERTEAAARRALELEPMLAEAHFSMALYRYWLTDDWPEAQPHFERALELDPRSSMMLAQYADFLALRHRFDDAVRYTEEALAIDPFSPLACGLGALAMYKCRRFDTAVDLAERALELHSNFALSLYALGVVHGQMEQYDRSIEALSRLLSITSRASVVIGMLGYAYAQAGRIGDAQLLLDELHARSGRQYVDPIGILLIYVGLDDLDSVERQLGQIIEVHAAFPNVEHLLAGKLDRLAAEPRFRELFRRLRLTARS